MLQIFRQDLFIKPGKVGGKVTGGVETDAVLVLINLNPRQAFAVLEVHQLP